ncbi:calcium-binding tyrosine phosphorylation-regulated protein [Phyllobates terribilis]|uniref:calcium-binding tyrosine phosphorylation-regulated protein n=1 Tax=Phyllobates terribilis TaxID=111132 RepID=UPI003CCAB99B
MSTKPSLLVPYGLKTLLQGLSQAVVTTQPANIVHYASFFFIELLHIRQENPSMDFKDLVQEFHRRPENTQMQCDPTQITRKSDISLIPPLTDKAGSEEADIEKEQWTEKSDPGSCYTSLAEAMPAVMNTEGVKDQQLVHTRSRVKASEQIAELPEKLDNVSQPTGSQSTKDLDKKSSFNGTVPKRSIHQTTNRQDLDGQYSLPGRVPSNDRQTAQAPFIPVRSISKPSNVVNLPGNKIISIESQHPPDQAFPLASESSMYIAKQTVESHMPATDLPPQEEAEYKVTSGAKQNLQRTSEVPSSNFYKIHISVDKPVSGMNYEPTFIPHGREMSMVHIVTSIPTGITIPTMISSETSPVHYMPAPNRPPPENIQTPTMQGMHPTQDPGQYRSVHAPSQQYAYPRPSPPQPQQATFRNNKGSKCQKKFNIPEADNIQGYLDASRQTSASDINQAGSHWMGSPDSGENDKDILWVFHQQTDMSNSELSVSSQYRRKVSPSQSTEDTECLLCMKDTPSSVALSTSLENVHSDEDKLDASSPYTRNGSSNSKTEHSWNKPERLIPIGRTKPNTEKSMRSFQDPMYSSESTPDEEEQQMTDSPSITYLAGTKSIPFFAAHRNTKNDILVEDPEKQKTIDAKSITHLAQAISIPSFAAYRNVRNTIPVEDPEEDEQNKTDTISVTLLAQAKSKPSFAVHRKARNTIPLEVPDEDEKEISNALSITHFAKAKSIPSFDAHRNVRINIPVEVPEDKDQKMSYGLSRTEAESIVSLPRHRKTIAEGTPASRSPSLMHGLNRKHYSWVGTACDEERQTIQD